MKCKCLQASGLLFAAFAIHVVDGVVSHPFSKAKARPGAHAAASLGVKLSLAGDVPSGKKIAVVLRGETFRFAYKDGNVRHRKACAQEAQRTQMDCTSSTVKKIIEPLERAGNVVEVFLTTLLAKRTRLPVLHKHGSKSETVLATCPLDTQIVNAYKANSSRTVIWRDFETTGQADTMLKVIKAFDDEYGGVEQAAAKFDYILFARNDMHWFKSLEETHANFSNVNVLSRCELGAGKNVGGATCVHDTFWMMPGYLYASFHSCLGKGGCYDPHTDPLGHGHGCQNPVRAEIEKAGHKDAFGWLADTRLRVHQHTPVADLWIAR